MCKKISRHLLYISRKKSEQGHRYSVTHFLLVLNTEKKTSRINMYT